ncbi:MAG: hypothetical protein JWN40_5684 [Phycisphaerales bacterium]|nr:hypothetical protein [Phycisphaerales bacterium]
MFEVIPEIVESAGGHKRIKVMIRDGDRVIDVDLIDPFQAAQRRKTAQRLAERAGEPQAVDRIEQVLLQCVDQMTLQEEGGGDGGGAAETEPMSIVRPELIIAGGVVGVSVPEVMIREGEAIGRWRLYLRLPRQSSGGGAEALAHQAAKDGGAGDAAMPAAPGADRRVSQLLAPRIETAGDAALPVLWVHPVPSAPSPSTPSGWTPAGRKAWLEGAADPDPVTLFDEVIAALVEYLDVEEQGKVEGAPHPLIATLALWVMLTYVYVAWDAVPYLFVTGPAGSGKTRVFELLSRLCFRPLLSSNLSAPALFRTLHDRGGTLLLDEAERLSEGGDDVAELRSILLAGYKRGGRASRLELSGDNYQMREFQVFGPKAIACINALPPALASRCVPVPMFRSPAGSDKPRRRLDTDPARWPRLRDGLHAALLGPMGKAASELASEPGFCPLGGRQYELWQPLLALAAWIDCERSKRRQQGAGDSGPAVPPLHPRLLDYARGICDGGSESLLPEEDFLLLWTLTDRAVRDEQPTCKVLLEVARRADPDAVRGISARRVAEILKRYGLSTVRYGGRRIYRECVGQLKHVESRYGIDLNTAGKENVHLLQVRRP